MTADQINGLFEFIGGILLWINCYQLYRDRELKGISWFPILFFTAWGYWNLYLYPAMNMWWSFAGGIFIVSSNTTWLTMLVYFMVRKGTNESRTS